MNQVLDRLALIKKDLNSCVFVFGIQVRWIVCFLKEALHDLNYHWGSSSPLTSRTHRYDPSLKTLKKWPVSCTASEDTWTHLPCSIFTWVTWKQKWRFAALSGMELPNLHFTVLSEFKIVYAALQAMNCFPPYKNFPSDASSQTYFYFS